MKALLGMHTVVGMREKIFEENDLSCPVFIGGMGGVIKKYEFVDALEVPTPKYPIKSTGAAAAILFEERGAFDSILRDELTYSTLFRHLLANKE